MRQREPHLAIAVDPAASLRTVARGEASAPRSRLLEHALENNP